MDHSGGLNMRNWGCYDQPLKRSLQLMPDMAIEREATLPMNFIRDGWIHHSQDSSSSNKILHVLPLNHSGYSVMPNAPRAQTISMLQPSNSPKEEKAPQFDDSNKKKRAQGRPVKAPKQKKAKKNASNNNQARDDASNEKKSAGLVINGIDFDLSGIPSPVCTCTGNPQQCYRWGIGGWQSACCTTSVSEYPLPMSTKRRGARISGRKMSQGAFIKVLEKLAGDGENLFNPIDLKSFWAKHGTNKFVTIR